MHAETTKECQVRQIDVSGWPVASILTTESFVVAFKMWTLVLAGQVESTRWILRTWGGFDVETLYSETAFRKSVQYKPMDRQTDVNTRQLIAKCESRVMM
jgi:hypothetical protein